MKSLLLFIIAVVSFAVVAPIAILYVALDAVFEILGNLALSIDMAGNVLASRPLNHLLIYEDGYKFGNKKETISSVLGKNKRDNTLTYSGYVLVYILDTIDTNHCIDAIDDSV